MQIYSNNIVCFADQNSLHESSAFRDRELLTNHLNFFSKQNSKANPAPAIARQTSSTFFQNQPECGCKQFKIQ